MLDSKASIDTDIDIDINVDIINVGGGTENFEFWFFNKK
jgi:hypothetical protein